MEGTSDPLIRDQTKDLEPMHRSVNPIWLIPAFAALLSGCALGRAEYKVVQATPAPAAASEAAGNTAPGTAPTAEAGATTGTASGPFAYTVREGESLWRICRRELGDPLASLRAARENRIANPDLIQPGQRLTLDRAWALDRASGTAPSPAPTVAAPTAGTPTAAAAMPGPTAAPTPDYPARPNRAFKPGEKLMFSVEYFGIAAGFATLAVEEGPRVQGRPTLRLVATARTHEAFEWFFKVRDRIESVFDAQGLFSWQYEKHLREGGYSNDSVLIYDQLNRQVIKDEGRTKVPAPPWTQDVLSEFYFFRTLDLRLGDTLNIPVLADDGKAYELLVTIARKQRISVPTGTFDCIVVVPALKFEGLFKQSGKIEIWVTDDEHRVPVLIKSQIVIGTIDIVLREATVVE
jgi:hypothetical protein